MSTHDYVIANASGSSVRSDLNNALAAIVSNNSSSSEPSTKYAYMLWVDTTNNLIKLRNSANNAWITLFTTAGGLDVDAASNFNEDVTFTGANYSSAWNKSHDAFEFSDNAKCTFGASVSPDLSIYHNGTHSFIDNSTGNLILTSTATDNVDIMKAGHSEYMARFKPDNAVELYYDGTKKLETTSDGVQISGTKLNMNSTYIDFSGSISTPSTAAAIYRPADNNLAFSTANTERLRIINGGGITFNGDTAAANALDDYEEGTWTPTVHFGGNSTGIVYGSNNGGSYTKVGRFVWVHGRVELSDKGSSTGDATIRGLPFTCSGVQSGASAVEGGAYFHYQHNWMSGLDYHSPLGYVQATTTVVSIVYRNNSGDTAAITDSDWEDNTSMSFEAFYPSTT